MKTIVKTPRLLIREFVQDDLDNLARLFGDAEVMKYMGDEVFTRDTSKAELDKCLGHYRERGWGMWALCLNETSEFIGRCGFLVWDLPEVQGTEVSFALLPEHWGKGYATEGATAVRDYAFQDLGLDRVISIVDPPNLASIRVAEKVHDGLEAKITFFGRPMQIFASTR
jgi:ribosomal-protein-alanine N-acetyltransferase